MTNLLQIASQRTGETRSLAGIDAIGAVHLAHDIHIPQVRGIVAGLRLSFVWFERCPHITQPKASVPTGPTQTSRRDFSFCARLCKVWSALLRPGIVARH